MTSPVWHVSIHAPTRGATKRRASWLETIGFQFTRPRGARRFGLTISTRRSVSIHAPTRGATFFARRIKKQVALFQFTRPRGARRCTKNSTSTAVMFQFTRPRGARLNTLRRCRKDRRFNSRAHAGRDALSIGEDMADVWFQFTRPRGARRRQGRVFEGFDVSIHAPTRGATSCPCQPFSTAGVSIHAPTRGATKSPRSS